MKWSIFQMWEYTLCVLSNSSFFYLNTKKWTWYIITCFWRLPGKSLSQLFLHKLSQPPVPIQIVLTQLFPHNAPVQLFSLSTFQHFLPWLLPKICGEQVVWDYAVGSRMEKSCGRVFHIPLRSTAALDRAKANLSISSTMRWHHT